MMDPDKAQKILKGELVLGTAVKRFNFEAAHFLPGYDGPCKNMHGHRWVVDVGITKEIDTLTGMIMDFSRIKEVFGPIVQKMDHCCLNDQMENPTAENIALYIVGEGKKILPYWQGFVRIWESETSSVQVLA